MYRRLLCLALFLGWLFNCPSYSVAQSGGTLTAPLQESWGTEDLNDEYVVTWDEVNEIETAEAAEERTSLITEEEISGPDAVDVPESLQRVRITLFKIKGWPEFKVGTKKRCKRVFGRKVCVNVPQAYERKCELTAFAEISHPKANTVRAKIESCVRKAVAAGALAGVYAGNLGAATAALKVSLKVCLAAEGVAQLNQLSVKVRTEKKCGDWKPR
jgi:hypothetical protein